MPTKMRHLRVDDELWSAAQSKAESDGYTLSDVIRGRQRIVRVADET
jgi:antitoxin component of RelBE/YafQ-DinJ toxin-antitoxin module